ncbi:MAG: hypothetical protein R2771_02445 [Saprospiraceae bacterium]
MKRRTSFASRYGRALEVVSVLKTLEDFSPTRAEENLENFQSFVSSLHSINNTVTQSEDATRVLTDARNALFYKGQDSVSRIFTALKSTVGYQYGFDSTEFKSLDIIWGRMVSTGLMSETTSEESSTEEGTPAEVKKTRRNSEKGYAAMYKNFEDFITTISGFSNYNPGPEKFRLESLNAKLTSIVDLNSSINDKKLELKMIKKNRLAKYRELKGRTDRIKSNIKTQYGADSEVYIFVSSLDFSA